MAGTHLFGSRPSPMAAGTDGGNGCVQVSPVERSALKILVKVPVLVSCGWVLTNDRKRSGFEQHRFIILCCWRPEV